MSASTLSPLALRPRLRSADFQQALGTRPVARSAHFSVHVAHPSLQRQFSVATASAPTQELSTGPDAEVPMLVDEVRSRPASPHRVWRLGLVLPKRMARRSVTRSLIKHQVRDLWRQHAAALEAAGWLSEQQPVLDWVVRLKAPWPREEFTSAASGPLKAQVRDELSAMLARLVRPESVAMPSRREPSDRPPRKSKR